MAGSRERLGPIFENVNARFPIAESRLASISSIDTDGYGWYGNAQISDPQIRIGFGFNIRDRVPPSDYIQAFDAKINGILNRVNSVDWLTRARKQDPSAKLEVRFVNDRSLSSKASTSIIKDLRKNGLATLAERIEEDLTNCVFLEIDQRAGDYSR